MGFRCGGALGRGAWARVACVGLRLYPWASSCLRWPAEREMGVYVGRPKFGVKLCSLPVLKATLGTGKGGFGSRVDSHWHGVSVRRSLGQWGLGTRGVRGPPAVSVGIGRAFRCCGALQGRGAWESVASVGLQLYTLAG